MNILIEFIWNTFAVNDSEWFRIVGMQNTFHTLLSGEIFFFSGFNLETFLWGMGLAWLHFYENKGFVGKFNLFALL